MRIRAAWLLLVLLAAGCGGGGGGGGSGTGKVSVGVTDAPVDGAQKVVVTFTRIELLDDGGNVKEGFDLVPAQQIDLLTLQGENSTFLIHDQEVPVGVYREVRLFVDADNSSCSSPTGNPASYVQVDGIRYPLIVPSGGSSGFKVKGPITVAAGGSAAYTVDFNIRKSIAARGGTGCYNLKPVLRVVDNAQVGTLAGHVDGSLLEAAGCTSDPVTGAGAAVYVFPGADVFPDDMDGNDPEPLTTALLHPDTSAGGFEYQVGFLLAGTYTVALTCQAGNDDPEVDDPIAFSLPINATIVPDTTTTVDFLP